MNWGRVKEKFSTVALSGSLLLGQFSFMQGQARPPENPPKQSDSLIIKTADSRPAIPAATKSWATTYKPYIFGANFRDEKLSPASEIITNQDGDILYKNLENTPRPIASITKLAVFMLMKDKLKAMGPEKAAEYLAQEITVTKEDVSGLTGYKTFLYAGQKLPLSQVWLLASQRSDNNAARLLARKIVADTPGGKGLEQDAVAELNRLLRDKVKAYNSRLGNTTGLPDGNTLNFQEQSEDISTAADLVKWLDYIWDNQRDDLSYLAENGKPVNGRNIHNTNRLMNLTPEEFGILIGAKTAKFVVSKTGTTTAAQAGLAGTVLVEDLDGKQYTFHLASLRNHKSAGGITRDENVLWLIRQGLAEQRVLTQGALKQHLADTKTSTSAPEFPKSAKEDIPPQSQPQLPQSQQQLPEQPELH